MKQRLFLLVAVISTASSTLPAQTALSLGDAARLAAKQSGGVDVARQRVAQFDREACVLPLLDATLLPLGGTLASAGQRHHQLTRVLRDSLQNTLNRLQWGQLMLATAGAISPFVGLLGTVWGIYNALVKIGMSGQASIDKVAGPVGESLIMTAIGLAVAVPAVLGYNWLVRRNKIAMEEVQAFGADLHAVLLGTGKGSGFSTGLDTGLNSK